MSEKQCKINKFMNYENWTAKFLFLLKTVDLWFLT